MIRRIDLLGTHRMTFAIPAHTVTLTDAPSDPVVLGLADGSAGGADWQRGADRPRPSRPGIPRLSRVVHSIGEAGLRACHPCGVPFADLARWIWPTSCPGCSAAGSWCAGCQPQGPPRILAGAAPVAAVDAYHPRMAPAIRAWKLGGRHDLTGPFAVQLARAIRALGSPDPVLVPVPARPSSLRRRGADLVAELAERCAREGGWRRAQPLGWRRAVGEQVGAPADRGGPTSWGRCEPIRSWTGR